jgi:hypothetical protein
MTLRAADAKRITEREPLWTSKPRASLRNPQGTHRRSYSYQILTSLGLLSPKSNAASHPDRPYRISRFPGAKLGLATAAAAVGAADSGREGREETGGSGLTVARGAGTEREAETEARGGRRRHCSCCCRESSHPRLASPRQLNTPPTFRSGWRGRRPHQQVR